MASVSIDKLDIVLGSTPILSRLSLDIADGEFLVLLGPSGCGKSTLLHALAGFHDVAGGSVRIGGRDVTWEDPKDRGIGMVFQSYALYPTMNVERNLSFGLRVAGVARDEIARRVQKAADMLHLGELLRRRPAQLSGGQRQRVAIGRALVRDARVYLFDEPLSNLDAKLRAELRRELKQLHQTLAATMIYVTHDQVEAMTLADRIAVMKSGVIQQVGTPDDIYGRPANLFVAGFLGSPTMNLLQGRLEPADSAPAGQPLAAVPGAVATVDGAPAAAPGLRFAGSGLLASLAHYPFLTSVPAGGEVVLGIRPEHLVLGPATAPATPWPARVTLVEPLGAQKIVWLESHGKPLAAIVPDHWSGARGSTVAFGFDATRVSLFDAATEARL